jgi:hypothetical protein
MFIFPLKTFGGVTTVVVVLSVLFLHEKMDKTMAKKRAGTKKLIFLIQITITNKDESNA